MPPPPLTVHLPVVAPRLALSSYCTISMAEVGLGFGSNVGVRHMFRCYCLPLAMLWFSLRVAFTFLLFGWNTARVFLSFPPRFVV